MGAQCDCSTKSCNFENPNFLKDSVNKLVRENQKLKEITEVVLPNECTFKKYGKKEIVQDLYRLIDCNTNSNEALCKGCVDRCYQGQSVRYLGISGLHDGSNVGRFGTWKQFKEQVMEMEDERQQRLLSW